jgi:hypothetical protein
VSIIYNFYKIVNEKITYPPNNVCKKDHRVLGD